MFPDWKHLIQKWRNQILNVQRVLVLGNGFVMIEDVMKLYEKKKLVLVCGKVTFLLKTGKMWMLQLGFYNHRSVNAWQSGISNVLKPFGSTSKSDIIY